MHCPMRPRSLAVGRLDRGSWSSLDSAMRS